MNIITIMSYSCEAGIVGMFASRLHKPKVTLLKRILIFVILFGSMALLQSQEHIFRNILLDVVSIIFVLSVLYDGTVEYAIYNALVLELINFLSELFVGNIVSHFKTAFWNVSTENANYIYFLISKIFFFLFAFFLSQMQRKNGFKHKRMEKEDIFINIMLICALVFLIVLSEIIFEVPYSTRIELLIFLAVLVLFVFLLFTMLLFRVNEKKSQDILNMRLQMQKNEDNKWYFKSIEQKDEGLKILIHDLKNHLHSLSTLNEQGEKEKVAEYIESLLKGANLKASIDISPNKLLNSIVYRYYMRALSEHINLSYDIRDVSLDYMDDIDVTSILCNLLDNAFEGCDGDKPFVEISIHEGNTKDSLVISVVNSCCSEPIRNQRGKFISKKYDEMHGFGIESVKRTTEKYDGEVSIYYEKESHTFHAVVLLEGEGCLK